jgi:fibronectin-binding autotransporter adhesin
MVFFDGSTTVSGGDLFAGFEGGRFIVESGTTTFNSITNDDGAVYIQYGSTVNVTGTLTDNGTFIVDPVGAEANSILNVSGGTVLGSGTFTLMEATYQSQVTGTLTQAARHTINGQGYISAALTNNGLVNANVNGGTLSINGATTNGGVIEASNGGTLSFAPGVLTNLSGTTLTGGTYEAYANSTISLPGSVTTNAATVVLDGAGSGFSAFNSVATNNGEFEIIGGRTFSTAGPLINAGTLLTGTGSALAVNGLLTQNSSGTLAGSGTFSATALELSGTISPGDAPGTLTLAGATIFESTLTLVYQLGSLSGTNDHLDVNGAFTLAGTIDITALAGFGAGDYDFIDYGGGTFTDGTLDVGSAPGGFDYEISTATPGEVDLMVTEVPEPATWAMILCGLGGLSLRKRFDQWFP